MVEQAPQAEGESRRRRPEAPPLQEIPSGSPWWTFVFVGILFILTGLAIAIGLFFDILAQG